MSECHKTLCSLCVPWFFKSRQTQVPVPLSFKMRLFSIFRMTRLLLLVAGLAVAGEGRMIQINEEVESLEGSQMESLEGSRMESLEGREGRGLADWFGWGGSQSTEAPARRIQGLQRRTSQVEVRSNTVFDIFERDTN